MRKLKDDIVEVSGDAAFNDLMALRPVSFKFKQTRPPNADPNFTKPQYGFIAEEVADVDPQITVYDNDGVTPKSWDERHVVPLLVKGFQIQQREIEAATGAFPFHKCLNWLPLLCSDK